MCKCMHKLLVPCMYVYTLSTPKESAPRAVQAPSYVQGTALTLIFPFGTANDGSLLNQLGIHQRVVGPTDTEVQRTRFHFAALQLQCTRRHWPPSQASIHVPDESPREITHHEPLLIICAPRPLFPRRLRPDGPESAQELVDGVPKKAICEECSQTAVEDGGQQHHDGRGVPPGDCWATTLC